MEGLELEVEGGGSRAPVSLSGDSPEAVLGRGDLGGTASAVDRTVSRSHVSLHFLDGGGEGEPPRVAFEIVGRNPVVVRSAGGSRVYRRGEAGELRDGDRLALSLRAPSFWAVRRSKSGAVEAEAEVLDAVARRERRTRERKERERRAVEEAMEVSADEEAAPVDAASSGELDAEAEDLKSDLASIDPVREFGFLSMGHEFDSYPKGRIRPPKDWNWFLEEARRSSDDEDDVVSKKGGRLKGKGMIKKDEGQHEDEDWTGESGDEKNSMSIGSSVKRSKYVTRSKEAKKSRKEKSDDKGGDKNAGDEEDEEDEEDETLGGFIVNEEDEPVEEPSEEEEFDDDDEDD
ncbi:hypothetical protein GUJ93_ZPchr0012g21898 [Zizania palustris]|uniref:FHA domain-containing protein n=1 Tax=Zizania palustris TaxID=103762 RepID=A0A8J5WSS5_ZIZPA|nr:hypothetical protein GUJ93_ZPchr0012g21898 [Zizania palustris]